MEPEELKTVKFWAELKDVRALIARTYSSSRMNDTKWNEAINALDDLMLFFRFQFVDVETVSEWMRVWTVGTRWFDTAAVGPFKPIYIEWMEIDPSRTFVGKLYRIEQVQYGTEIEQRLQAVQVPYDWAGDYIKVTGYVR